MKKKTTKSAQLSEQAVFNAAIDMLMSIPEVKESMSTADITLAFEDVGWVRPGDFKTSYEIQPERREKLVQMSRAYWAADPLAKQAVRLWTDYAIASGISYKLKDEATREKSAIDDFWKNHRNKRLTSSKGQQKLSRKLLVDGEIFFVIVGGEGETKTIRTLDPLQISEVISDPDDEDNILAYKRVTKGASGKTLYYRDWAADPTDVATVQDSTGKTVVPEENMVIFHLTFDDLGQRGHGLLFPIINWTKEHRRFMEARVSLTQALAKFAWKLSAKGGPKVIDELQRRFQSSLAAGPASLTEKNPAPSRGATWAQNQGVELEAMPRSTGAGDAKSDGDQLKLMVSAGTNIMLHYFGDPSTGNLATAEAMELPMLKSFTSYQEMWEDAWRDIFSIVLDEDIDEQPAEIEVKLPQMLKDDLQRLGNFLMGLHQVFPEIQVPEILQACLVALGLSNVEDIMTKVEAKREELKAQMGDQLPPPTIPKGNTPPRQSNSPSSEAAALNRLAEVLESLNGEPDLTPQQHIQLSPQITFDKVTVQEAPKPLKKRGKARRNKAGEIEFELEELSNGS